MLVWLKDEAHIMPFFLRHYSFADQIIVWDNESTDASRSILESDSRVVIHNWDTGGESREDELLRLKNEEYHKTGPGWKFIVDADEFYYHPHILQLLDMYDQVGITLAQTQGFDMVSTSVPVDDGHSLLTDLVKDGVANVLFDKWGVVRDNCKVTYSYGAHHAKEFSGRAVASVNRDIKLLHYRYLSKELVVEKALRLKPSEQNKKIQVGLLNADPEHMGARWEMTWQNRKTVL